jgi:uncharacterized membrane protein
MIHSKKSAGKFKKGALQKDLKITAIIFLVILSFLVTIMFYPSLPENMASHWGINGEANGFMPKEYSAFFIPILAAVIAMVLYYIPRLDPLYKNIEKFKGHYELFIINMVVFFLFLQTIVLLWNIGILVDFNQVLSLAFAMLFFSVGMLVENARKNYFIGIRTPWALYSEEVWNHTNKFGGKAFKACAIISLLGVFASEFAFHFIVVPIITAAIAMVVYSYTDYRKTARTGKPKRK